MARSGVNRLSALAEAVLRDDMPQQQQPGPDRHLSPLKTSRIGMNARLVSTLVGVALALAVAGPVAADTGGGGESDLGLEGFTLSGATVNTKTGVATVTGSISCSQDVEGYVGVELRQSVGRFFTVAGWGGSSFTCLASTGSASVSLIVQPEQGKFGGGKASAHGFAQAEVCSQVDDEEYCDYDFADSGSVRLRLGRHA
jgi:hypothetical protein